MKPLSRNEQVIRYIVSRCGRVNGRVRLLKFVYLADYLSRRYAGRPISTFKWFKHDFGPFDAQFYGVLDTLKEGGYIEEHPRPWAGGIVYEFEDTGKPVAYELSLTDLYVLDRVVEQHEKANLRELLDDVVYSTEPWAAVDGKPLRTQLNMEAIDKTGAEELGGLSLDTMLRSRQEIREGQYITFEDFLRELHSSNP